MKIDLTQNQVELLQEVLNMQLNIEQEHLEFNCSDSIDRNKTKSIIRRIHTLQKKFNQKVTC